jgi:hypothetical protein
MEEINNYLKDYFKNLELIDFKSHISNDFLKLDNFFSELYSERIPWEHSRTFVIGFYTPKGSTFDVEIGGKKICTNQTKDSDFIFAIRDQYIIPFIKLMYHDVKLDIKEDHEVFVIYGKVNEKKLQMIHKYPIYCFIDTYPVYYNDGTFGYYTDPGYLCCHYGMAGKIRFKHQYLIEHIDLPILNKINYQELSKERNDLIFQELMEITWHPSRFRRWCLDYTDEFNLKF